MKKILFSTLTLLILTLSLTSCDKYLDKMGKDPYAVYDAPAQEYVHPIMFKTTYNSINIFRTNTSLLMQYAVSRNVEATAKVVSNYNITEALVDDTWNAYYILYGNAVKMYDQALKDKNSPREEIRNMSEGMQGVALILKAMLITQITDTYGDVPFRDAGILALSASNEQYTTAYDLQKDIYIEVIGMLEDANTLLANSLLVDPKVPSFNSVCDKTFGGSFEKWRRFGNSLYARVLMRIGMKVIEENGGNIEFPDDSRPAFALQDKLAELYQCFNSGEGEYPMMRGRSDRPLVPFDSHNEVEQTPFYTYTSGVWNANCVCDALTRRMLYTEAKIFEITRDDGTKWRPCGDQIIYVSDVAKRAPDPRFACWWRKANGMPTQMTGENVKNFYENYLSTKGNFKCGAMMRGHADELDPLWEEHYYDLQNASSYALMQYSELCFIFAEAGSRGWVAAVNNFPAVKSLLRKGVTESILEWNPDVTESSDRLINYVNWVMNSEKFSYKNDHGTITLDERPLDEDNALEAILTEKWISQFFIGSESWSDYRRTGFPLLKTNGPAADNDQILPTRMRYPSDEKYRNMVSYREAVDRLGGTDNMQTDVWWASTDDSKKIRLLGRQ